MSGHSKWSKIKHKKEATDKKKGQLFGRVAKEIGVLSRDEKDPAKNAALRDAIARAKKINMPQANIDRLLSNSEKPLTSILYEVFGPAGSALLVMAETDNSNRTLQELRLILKDHGGNLGGIGTVKWKFAPQTVVEGQAKNNQQLVSPAFDEIELSLIDAGAGEIEVHENDVLITAPPEAQANIEETLLKFAVEITESKIIYAPTQPLQLSEPEQAKLKNLTEALQNHSDVVDVFSDA